MKRLYRSHSEHVIAGVCAGIGEYADIDPTIIRLVWVCSYPALAGCGVIAYAIAWIIVPEGQNEPGSNPEQKTTAPGGSPTYLLKRPDDFFMRILFVVCGEGLGHASRCIHLGHYLQIHGHEIHFAGYGKSYNFMRPAPVQHPASHSPRSLPRRRGWILQPEKDTLALEMDRH